jgi:hypothetical protein
VTDPRTRRLIVEHDAMRAAFVHHSHIEVEPIGWHPADRYRVTYRVPGVTLDVSGQPALVQEHVVVVSAGETYPRDRPTVRAETALFHPNVSADATRAIDSGTPWTAQRTLVDLVLQVGALIQLQEYDLDGPLNAIAARWVAENASIFPVGHVSLRVEGTRDGADQASGAMPTDDGAQPPEAAGNPLDQLDRAVSAAERASPDPPRSVWAPPGSTAS